MTPNVLFMLPPGWNALGKETFASPRFTSLLYGRDDFAREEIDYFVGFRPPPGYLKTLPRLKAVLSLGAGVDGFLKDPDFPAAVPLVRFVDPSLAVEMAQYVTLHALILHRHQRDFDSAQADAVWRQMMLPRASRDTRIGILGLGTIGAAIAQRMALYDFAVSGWSRTAKSVPGVKSFFGEAGLDAFLAQCDMLVCVLPLTPQTTGILNAALFAKLPRGAVVINVARGAHLNEDDLIAALDSGHLGHAVLDVFQTEPLPDGDRIWKHPKITATPHIAGITDPKVALAYIEDCVTRFESGTPVSNIVDVFKGY